MSRPGDPRDGQRYRTTAAQILAESDRCWLCGHGGARTIDHIVTVKNWLAQFGTYEGVNHLTNLAPAHGAPHNPCPTCAQHCNQLRGSRSLAPQPRSRDW
jgi:hypothetical protein